MIKKKNMARGVAAFVLAAFLSGCGGGVPIVSEVRETSGYSDPQTMIVIATEKNRYRNVYTDQIWQVQVKSDGTTFETYLLEEIRSFLRELKTMNMLADEQKIKLSGQDKERLRELSQAYFDSLTPEDVAYMGIDEDDVYAMYEQYHRANLLVDELTKDVNLEISDSEAKIITVQEIKVSDPARAEEIYGQAAAEGADFASVARSYSEDAAIEKQVGRSERSRTYEDAVFSLAAGQVSPVFQDGDAYYIVKCISDYDEAATLERKEKLALLRKNQAFRQIYDAYAAEHQVEIEGSIWDKTRFQEGDQSVTTGFFDLYQDYMQQ